LNQLCIQAIYTWVNYRKGCFDTLNTEPFAVNEDLEKIDNFESNPEEIYMIVRFTWNAGVGQICLAVASLLKVVDILFNCIVPTPTIARNHAEQVEYEWKYGKRIDNNDNMKDGREEAKEDAEENVPVET